MSHRERSGLRNPITASPVGARPINAKRRKAPVANAMDSRRSCRATAPPPLRDQFLAAGEM